MEQNNEWLPRHACGCAAAGGEAVSDKPDTSRENVALVAAECANRAEREQAELGDLFTTPDITIGREAAALLHALVDERDALQALVSERDKIDGALADALAALKNADPGIAYARGWCDSRAAAANAIIEEMPKTRSVATPRDAYSTSRHEAALMIRALEPPESHK